MILFKCLVLAKSMRSTLPVKKMVCIGSVVPLCIVRHICAAFAEGLHMMQSLCNPPPRKLRMGEEHKLNSTILKLARHIL